MYPYLKLATTLIQAKYRSKLQLQDSSILKLRVGLTDIDPFMELNNARYFSYMELGRWDYSHRVGFMRLMKKHNWGVAVGGASVRFRRRIPFFNRFSLSTRLVCHDGRWFYFLQEMHMEDKICSSALMKVCATSKKGLVPASEVAKYFDKAEWAAEVPGWVNAWLEAESQRPWPKE